jgi:uncharacterized protein (UPF0210 family)
LRRFEATYREAGCEVQTVRLSTRSVFEDLAGCPARELIDYAHTLQSALDEAGLEFCSLGSAPAHARDFPLEAVDLIPDLLVECPALNVTVQLAWPGSEPRLRVAQAAAHVISRLAAGTVEGVGNFRFAALACVPPGTPFFPAAYHQCPASVSIGLQGASIVREALQESHAPADLNWITDRVRDAIGAYATPIVDLAGRLAGESGIEFGGIDCSPAPMGTDSIVAAIEAASGRPFGSPGTLAVIAALTAGIKSVALQACGYNGLMLPVLEDAVLGERWKEGRVGIRDLLFYSSVCGTGLDTVPLPGDSTDDQIAGILLDVAALAVRLNKPLSARLFPVPGTRSGDMTSFTSPYLTNTVVKW